MIEILATIEAPHFNAGIVLWDDRVIEAAPIIGYMKRKRWTRDQVRDYCASKGWSVSVVYSARACATMKPYPQDIDPRIRQLRLCLCTGYVLQAMQCVVGAFQTLIGMWLILNHSPILGGICIILAFFVGVNFCDVTERRSQIKDQLHALHDLRQRLVEEINERE